MSDEIDNKVVSMKFDNQQFEQRIAQTMASLQKLDASLSKAGAGKGLSDIQAQANKMNFDTISRGIEGVSAKFVALSTIAITTLANITNRAVDAGIRIAKSLTIAPIADGFAEYELTIGSIQTMLANTARYGTKLPEVTANLDELNAYADKTIYNFGDMTKNIGLFTNAGIRIGDATSMIQGFSNVAAASGTSAEGAAGAAYQLSQALSAGTIRLMDWRSLTNVGMGNKNMQDSLIQLGTAMGAFNSKTTTAAAAAKDFNGSLESKWLSGDIMEQYLKIMAGKVTPAQMKQLGLTEKQIVAFQKQQKTAEEAATKVRTFAQLRTTITESIGSSWSESFRVVVGDFEQATELWTKVNEKLGGIIGQFGDSRNELLKGWAEWGGREKLIEALNNAFDALYSVIKNIAAGFRAVFPPMTVRRLVALTYGFAEFTEKLKMGADGLNTIKQISRAFFSVIKIGLQVFSGLRSLVTNTFSIFKDSLGPTDQLTGGLRKMLDTFSDWAKNTTSITDFFEKLRTVQAAVLGPIFSSLIELAKGFAALASGDTEGFFARIQTALYALSPLTELFNGAVDKAADAMQRLLDKFKAWLAGIAGPTFQPVTNFIDGLQSKITTLKEKLTFKPKLDTSDAKVGEKALGALQATGSGAKTLWDGIVSTIKEAARILKPLIDGIGNVLSAIGQKLVQWAKDLDFTDVMLILNAGLIYGIYRLIKNFSGKLDDLIMDLRNMVNSITGIFDNLTQSLKVMQADVKANIILKIAIAVGVLAASLWVLGNMDTDAVVRGLFGIAAVLGLLSGVMLGFLKMADNSTSGMMKLMGIGAVLVAVSGAVLVMAGAVKIIGSMKPEQVATGIAAIGAILGGLMIFVKKVGVAPAGLIATAAAMVPLAIALNIFASSVFLLGSLKPEVLKQGLAAIGAILVGLAGISKIMTGAVGMVATAAGMVLLAGALIIFAGAVKIFGSMDPKVLATGIGSIAASLLVLVVAMTAAQGMVLGAVALVIAAGAIVLLAQAMQMLGTGMDDRQILRGIATMLALTGVLAAFGAVAYVFGPALLLLSVAILGVGAAMLIAGVGMMLFGTGLKLVAEAGLKTVEILKAALIEIINIIPELLGALATGLVNFVTTLASNGETLTKAFASLIGVMLDAISDSMPKLRRLIDELVTTAIQVLDENAPDLIAAGGRFLKKLLKGIENDIPELVTTVSNIIVKFINELSKNLDRIINAGSNLIQEFLWGIARESLEIVNTAFTVLIIFLNGLEQSIRENMSTIVAKGFDIAEAIIEGMINGLKDNKFADRIRGAVEWVANLVPDGLKNVLKIFSPSRVTTKIGEQTTEGFAKGLINATSRADMKESFAAMSNIFKEGLKEINEQIADAKAERDRLMKDENASYADIRKAFKEVDRLQAEKKRILNTRNNYNKYLDDERAKLLRLAGAYETVTKKLEAAKDNLQQLKDDKKSKYEELFNQYNTLPDIGKQTGLQGYLQDVKSTTQANEQYKKSLDKLRKLGLDDASYKKLLAEGADAQSLVNQLAEGGKGAVSEFNKTNKALESSAKKLAQGAANQLFDAGIKAAEGLVKGLQKQQANINKEMDRIANYMVSKIKKGLGIKSPSRKFMEIARQMIAGLVKGLKANKSQAGVAIDDIGDNTVVRMKDYLDRIRDMAENDISSQPVITPVVDLDKYRKALKSVNDEDISGVNWTAISARVRAAIAAQEKSRNDGELAEKFKQQIINFNQTNNSPEALSTVDIYRQTKTLVAQAKKTG